MRTKMFIVVLLPLLVLALAGVSHAWQGRMGGAGDPYGLLQDESDFLIHPAKFAKGEGVKFYGNYRFTYTDVMDWDYNLDQLTPAGVLVNYFHFDTSGQEYKNNALLGAATPLGPGRFGIFFTYDGMRGDYDGDEDILGTSNFGEYDLIRDFDNFALRLLYGLPVLGMDAGLELGMAYRDEMQETWKTTSGYITKNFVFSWGVPERTLFPLMIPYDSNYWELLWKAGMEKELGPLGITVSLGGGYIIASDSSYKYLWQANVENVDMEGDVAGWRIGSDIWLRYDLNEGLTLPFLFSINYAAKNRDGDGIDTGTFAGGIYDYEYKEQEFDIKVGGGIEKELGDTTVIAAGLYYNYLQRRNDFSFFNIGGYNWSDDSSEFPSHNEHMMIVRVAGEKGVTHAVVLRMGLDFFYGWVQEDFVHARYGPGIAPLDYTNDVSLNGYRWGIGGSLGGSVQFDSFTMEPFFNVGWQQVDLSGDGENITFAGVITNLWGMDLSRDEWYIGGGISFLYNLP